MAPNIPLIRPVEEILAPPVEIIRNENSAGSHRVVSTYAKNEGSNPGYRNSDPATTGETKDVSNHPTTEEQRNPQVKTRPDQKQRPHGGETGSPQTATHKPQGHTRVDQPRRNGEPLNRGKELMNAAPVYQEAIMGRDIILNPRSSEEFDGTGFLGPILSSLDSKEYDTDFFETLSRLRQRGYSNFADLLDNPMNHSNTPRPVLAAPKVRKPQNTETDTEKPYTYETELSSPVNPPAKSNIPHLVTTYRPSKRHSFYQHDSSDNINTFANEKVATPLLKEPTHTDQNDKSSNLATKSPLVVREIMVQQNSEAGLKEFEKELQDFSNLFHHEKSLAELSKSAQGVAVREDDWFMSNEGSTAVILVGMCSLIMILICFLFVMKKFHRQIRGKGKKELVEEEEKANSIHHKHHFGSDFHNLHIPANLIPHLPFLHSLTHHHHHNLTEKPESTTLPSSTSDEELTDSQLGRLWFSVRYDDEKFDLRVNVMHAKYPKGREVTSNTGELWVEGTILSPMNTVIATSKTTTRRATYSPVFNHCFLFLLEKKEVKSYILKLTLHDQHPKKGQEVVGSIIFPFSSIDISSAQIYCRDLL